MLNIFQSPPIIPNEKVDLPILREKGIDLWIKRLDLVHPLLSGNKYFKLKYNLREAQNLGFSKILTFGGAYSNHIYATAAAGHLLGLQSIGVIRGEEHLPLNPTLAFAKSKGMNLFYLSRSLYQNKTSSEVHDLLKKEFGEYYMIPEGGTNALAIQGTSEILSKEDAHFDVICTSIGTGGTFVGIVNSLQPHQTALGFSSLKGSFISNEIKNLLIQYPVLHPHQWEIEQEFHFGGYGKFTSELIQFMTEFYEQTGIPLDPIYTGKMMFGIISHIKTGVCKQGHKILALHTGGLQGISGFNERHGTQLPGFLPSD
jgi:1-aminocyclopropane-1-carboxylate deaminase